MHLNKQTNIIDAMHIRMYVTYLLICMVVQLYIGMYTYSAVRVYIHSLWCIFNQCKHLEHLDVAGNRSITGQVRRTLKELVLRCPVEILLAALAKLTFKAIHLYVYYVAINSIILLLLLYILRRGVLLYIHKYHSIHVYVQWFFCFEY